MSSTSIIIRPPQTGGTASPSEIAIVANMAALRSGSLHTNAAIKQVNTQGYRTKNDGGQNKFIYNPADTTPDDGGYTIKPTSVSGAGRWNAIIEADFLPIKQYGAVADYQTFNVSVNQQTGKATKVGFGSYLTHGQAVIGNAATNLTGRGNYNGGIEYNNGDVVNNNGQLQYFLNYFRTITAAIPNIEALNFSGVHEVFSGEIYGVSAADFAQYQPGDNFVITYDNGATFFNAGRILFKWDGFGPQLFVEASPGTQSVGSCGKNGAFNQPVQFAAKDVGKYLLIKNSRTWPAIALDAIGLNAKITAIDGAGLATIAMQDAGRGEVQSCTNQPAEMFTDNTDYVANAIKAAQRFGLGYVENITGGTLGFIPFFSNTFESTTPYADGFTPLFQLYPNFLLQTTNGQKAQWKLSYHVAYEPNRNAFESDGIIRSVANHLFGIRLFMADAANSPSINATIKNLSVAFGNDESVYQAYQLFSDVYNTVPVRNNHKILFENVDVLNPENNIANGIESSHGGLYDEQNNMLDETTITLKNCKLQCAFDIKNNNNQSYPQTGGKTLTAINTVFDGGGLPTTRHYKGQSVVSMLNANKTVTVGNSGFSWYLFNRFSNEQYHFTPYILLRETTAQSDVANITQAVIVGDEIFINYTDADFTRVQDLGDTCKIMIGLPDSITSPDWENVVYQENAILISNIQTGYRIKFANPGLNVAQVAALVGKEIRHTNRECLVKVRDFGAENIPSSLITPQTAIIDFVAGDVNFYNENPANLDATINYNYNGQYFPSAVFGHTGYVSSNCNFNFIDTLVKNCGKRNLRVSPNASNAKAGTYVLQNHQVAASRGRAAFANNVTTYYSNSEVDGTVILKGTKEKPQFFNTVGNVQVLDANHAIINANALYQPSLVSNSQVYCTRITGNHPLDATEGQQHVFEDCTLSYLNTINSEINEDGNLLNENSPIFNRFSPTILARRCSGTLYYQAANINLIDCFNFDLGFNIYVSQNFEQFVNGGSSIAATNTAFKNYFTNIGYFNNSEGRLLFTTKNSFKNCGVDSAAYASTSREVPYLQFINKLYQQELQEIGFYDNSPYHHSPGYYDTNTLLVSSLYNQYILNSNFFSGRPIKNIHLAYNVFNTGFNGGFGYRDAPQQLIAIGAALTLTPGVSSISFLNTGNITPLNLDQRPTYKPIYLVYNGVKWVEVERL